MCPRSILGDFLEVSVAGLPAVSASFRQKDWQYLVQSLLDVVETSPNGASEDVNLAVLDVMGQAARVGSNVVSETLGQVKQVSCADDLMGH